MRKKLLFICIAVFSLHVVAQAPKKETSGTIHAAIKKLNFLGSALYIAAHPDDENTRLITYLSNDIKANTAYLSLTRGDGGQNLIGTEIREELGIIRTQELLAARRTDGGKQFFSRANDFGYSKHPNETFKIWNKDDVLSDVVWVIRNFQPDVIINRFDYRTPGTTHGHHTGSAILSFEAFDLAGQDDEYADQLSFVDPWQPNRLFFNTSWWFYGSQEKFEKADKTNLYSLDIGTYYPLVGKSNNEIASESRSMHKSQGFGSIGTRGSSTEYLEWLKGDKPVSKEDIFSGINTTWSRLENGEPIGKLITEIDQEFNPTAPQESLPKLLKARKKILKLKDSHWKSVKLEEIEEIIYHCTGLYLEVIADEHYASPSSEIKLDIEAINRLGNDVILHQIHLEGVDKKLVLNKKLEKNVRFREFEDIMLPANLSTTNAYWLNNPGTMGMYHVDEQQLISLPETPRFLKARFEMEIDGQNFTFFKNIVYKERDPVKGEVYKPFDVTTPVFVDVVENVYIFADDASKKVAVKVRAGKDNLKGKVEIELPKSWKVSPKDFDFSFKNKNEERVFTFEVTPPNKQSEVTFSPIVTLGKKEYSDVLSEITYDHIPHQMVMMKEKAKVVRLDIKKKGDNIGYIMGAGDLIPESLEQIGYTVHTIDIRNVTEKELAKLDAIIIGIRAFNTEEDLGIYQYKLFDYIKNGGTVIAQYNTNRGLKVKNIAPFALNLSRDRVTDENAKVKFINPKHQILNYPNKITKKDFEGWVQERGLYFANKWDKEFEPILSSHDEGESAKEGGLLVAKYGEGYFIYTGYSWFRELPAGVPGAYRIFANLISIGKK
ncbi:PIG-L family deacetylase [Aureivirga marina]|uniref:PIG-L family deacetylase n=1 Tax=Aureivirga marina TaxID=1182451 RepID=UPI0018CA68FF|nr:PIG-L family deacetylase [Aureivirga marina]